MGLMPRYIHGSHDEYVADAKRDIDGLEVTSQDLANLIESGDIRGAADEWARGHNHYVYRYLHRDFFTKVGDWEGLSEAYKRACDSPLPKAPGLNTEGIIRVTLSEMVREYLAYVYTDAVWQVLLRRDLAGDAVATKYLTDKRNEAMAG